MVYLAGTAVVLIGSFAVMNTLLTQQAEPIVSPAPERSAQPPVNKEASPKENVKAQPQPEIISPAPQGPKNNPPADDVIVPIDRPEQQLPNASNYMKGEVLVGLKPGIDVNSPGVADLIARNGGKIAQYNRQIRVILVQVEAGKEQEFIQKVTQSALVEYAELNRIANPAP